MRKKQKNVNSAQLIFPALSQNESLSRSFISIFLMQANPTVEEISDLKCAVSEAVTNCIVHAYRGGDGIIKLRATLYEDEVSVEITDRGCGIDDVEKAKEPLFTTNTDGERSGMGFTVMKTFTDKMRVSSKIGKGTKVTLIKKIGKESCDNT